MHVEHSSDRLAFGIAVKTAAVMSTQHRIGLLVPVFI